MDLFDPNLGILKTSRGDLQSAPETLMWLVWRDKLNQTVLPTRPPERAVDHSSSSPTVTTTLNRAIGMTPMVVGSRQTPNRGPTTGTTTPQFAPQGRVRTLSRAGGNVANQINRLEDRK